MVPQVSPRLDGWPPNQGRRKKEECRRGVTARRIARESGQRDGGWMEKGSHWLRHSLSTKAEGRRKKAEGESPPDRLSPQQGRRKGVEWRSGVTARRIAPELGQKDGGWMERWSHWLTQPL